MTDTAAADAAAAIRQWCAEAEVEWQETQPGQFVIVLPGEQKLRTTVSASVAAAGITINAFVIRHPDENEPAVHRWLLERNRRIFGMSYAIDPFGDIFLVGVLPAAGFNTDAMDQLMGSVLANADEVFNHLLELGFSSAIRAEWRWRLDRGESTRNLEAFRHLAEPRESPPQ